MKSEIDAESLSAELSKYWICCRDQLPPCGLTVIFSVEKHHSHGVANYKGLGELMMNEKGKLFLNLDEPWGKTALVKKNVWWMPLPRDPEGI
jgi:hypothetical protein